MTISLWTYQDAVDHILDTFDVDRTPRSVRQAKRAILNAYRDLPGKCDWKYFQDRFVFASAAQQATGTIEYDHTGGTYERVVTLTDATWPADASLYSIIINDNHYEIESYKSSTEVTLPLTQNPGTDIASGTSYIAYRSVYPLPLGFRKIGVLWDMTGDYEIRLAGNQDVHALSMFYDNPGTPISYAIRNAKNYLNSLSVDLAPPPSYSRTYGAVYLRSPRSLNTEELATGTVSTSGTTLTFTNGVLKSKHVGSVIRLSDSDTAPASRVGSWSSTTVSSENVTDAVEERIITAVNSTVSATIDQAFTTDVSAKGYTISDPLDLEYTSQLSYFWALASLYFARYNRRSDVRDLQVIERQELLEAMAADSRDASSGMSSISFASVPFHKRPWSTMTPDEQTS